MAKNDNMLAILWMLNTGEKVTAKQIADKLEMNIRTVYRYIDALSASGVPILSDAGHNGGYTLQNNFIKAPLLFDMDEKKALLHAAAFAKEAGYPLSAALDSATSKLFQYSNEEQGRTLDHHRMGLDVINSTDSASLEVKLSALDRAVAEENAVAIEYRTGREENSQKRKIDPYGLVYWNHKWYVVGFCHLRREIRSFRVERILKIESSEDSFIRPENFSPREFFIGNLLPTGRGSTEKSCLVIKGGAEALDDLCIHWYLGHYLKERSLEQAVFTLDEETMHAYVPNLLLSYGKSIKVLEPQSMKDKMVQAALELMTYYEN